MKILGISAFYHDSAACLLDDGRIVAAAQEERFTRIKHDHNFPKNAIRYCLTEGGVKEGQLDAVAFYDKPLLKFHRILETYLGVVPAGFRSFFQALPLWIKQKLWIPVEIESSLKAAGIEPPEDALLLDVNVQYLILKVVTRADEKKLDGDGVSR